jgi:hypothetical protein
MFRFYVLKGENLPKGDVNGKSDPYCVIEHQSVDGKLYRIGQTLVIPENLNPQWDVNNKIPFDFPFTRANDSALTFHIWDHDRFSAPDHLATLSIRLCDVPLRKDLSYKLIPDKPARSNPMLWIWVETGFEKMVKCRTALKMHNYFYVFMEYPRGSPKGSSAELKIYQCDDGDGGFSELITADMPQPNSVERQTLKEALNSAGADQLFRFDVANIDSQRIFLPLIKVESYGGDFKLTFALLAYNELPQFEQDKDGVWLYHQCRFDPAVNMKPCMQMIDQLPLAAPVPTETYSSPCAFQFLRKEVAVRPVVTTWQKARPWLEFSKELRKHVLPKNVVIWDHRHAEVGHIYPFANLGEWHSRGPPVNIRITCQWEARADVDLSLCALNRNSQCVGRVSFKDLICFDRALEHFPPFREDGKGFEEVAIRFGGVPKQVKLILVVVTLYRGESLVGMMKLVDDADLFELLCHNLKQTSSKPGLLFGIFVRRSAGAWDFVSALVPVDAKKPYDAHALLKQFLPDSDYLQKLYRRP